MDKAEEIFTRRIPIAAKDEKWGLYATAAGNALVHADAQETPGEGWKILPDFLLIFISRGSVELELDRPKNAVFYPGTVVCVAPGCRYRFHAKGDLDLNLNWVSFNGSFARQLLYNDILSSDVTVFKQVDSSQTRIGFDRLFAQIRNYPIVSSQIISADLFHLLSMVLTIENEAVPTRPLSGTGDELIADAVALMQRPGNESITVERLVDEMAVARRTLERAFRSNLGHGIHEEILKTRLRRARLFLADSSLCMTEIAIKSGFDNTRSMRRAFTAEEGMSPHSFRQQLYSTSPDRTHQLAVSSFDA